MSSSTLKHFLDQLSSLNLLERREIQVFGLFSWFGIGSQKNSRDKKKFEVGNKILGVSFLQVISFDAALVLNSVSKNTHYK